MSPEHRALALAIACVLALIVLLFSVRITPARDLGQWDSEHYDPKIVEWYRSLMQPDVPNASCCGEADAYWADEIHVRDGKTYAVITDPRDDGPLGRPHVPVGTEILVPDHKLKWDRGNPTGHAIIFLAHGWDVQNYIVYCFVQNGGT